MSPNGRIRLASPDVKSRAAALWRAIRGDGCSSVPDWHRDYTECCNRHDADYRTGTDENGNRITRAKADQRLFACMKKESRSIIGRTLVSTIYYAGVRLFGSPHWKGKQDAKSTTPPV